MDCNKDQYANFSLQHKLQFELACSDCGTRWIVDAQVFRVRPDWPNCPACSQRTGNRRSEREPGSDIARAKSAGHRIAGPEAAL